MSNLPSVKRTYVEDYKESPPWFARFLGQLNLYTEPVYNILNGAVDVTANTTEEIYYLTIKNAASLGTDNATTFVPRKFIGAPHGITIGQCLIDGTTGTETSVTMSWEWTGGEVSILAIFGLADGEDHVLTLRIW